MYLLLIAGVIGFAVYLLYVSGGTLSLPDVFERRYSKSELVNFASNAGFSGDDANTAAAIALAESSGIAARYNPETQANTPAGLGSFGLWQIYLKAHPEFMGMALYDPQVNANVAFQVYNEQGWTAWTTYKTGAYKEFL